MQDSLENILVSFVQPQLQPMGFYWVPAFNQFRRDTEWGFQAIIISFSHYDDLSIVEFFFGFRVNAVENLSSAFLNTNAINSEDQMSLIVSSSKLLEKSYDRTEMRDKADAILVGRELLQKNATVGLPFFKENASLAAIEHLFNGTAGSPHPYFSNTSNRAIRGIALAHLNGQKFIDDLVLKHRFQMEQKFALPHQKDRFEQFVQLVKIL